MDAVCALFAKTRGNNAQTIMTMLAEKMEEQQGKKNSLGQAQRQATRAEGWENWRGTSSSSSSRGRTWGD